MALLKIVIAGVGTVGTGVLNILAKNKLFIEKKINKKIIISAVASRSLNKKIVIPNGVKIFKKAEELLNFSDYDILVELIGGDEGIAKKIIFDALKKKKNVVTANKALIAKHGKKLKEAAEKSFSNIGFEASVAGVIPIVKILNEFLISNKVKKVFGVLNGTSNFILSKMLETKKNFNDILDEAKKLGYAEADPKFDINGTDTAHKIAILSMISFENELNLNTIYTEGIEKIELDDLLFADSLGYKIKLIGITEKVKDKVSQYVYPSLINKSSVIANVNNVYNGVVVESDFSNKLFFQGHGAGSFPTATSVISDIINISDKKKSYDFYLKSKNFKTFKKCTINERYGSYYLRLVTDDKPGVIADISNEFKKQGISMKSMLQKEDKKLKSNFATIILTTHDCFEKEMKAAVKKINKLHFIRQTSIVYRIENI